MKNIIRPFIFFCTLILLQTIDTQAQGFDDNEKKALLLISQKEYRQAIPILHQLFEGAPYDKKYYDHYYKALLEVKSYDTAIALCDYMQKIRQEDLSIIVDKGNAQMLNGKEKEANKTFELAINTMQPNELQAQSLASAFRFINNSKYELETYEKFQKISGNPYAFAYELAMLYEKAGQTDKAIDMLLQSLAVRPFGIENAKQALEIIIDNQPKKQKKVESAISKKVSSEPNNYLWRELFGWLQSSKGDKTEQLNEIIKLDEAQYQQGLMVFNWSKEQFQNDAYEYALQGLNYIIKLPQNNPVRANAMQMYLAIQNNKLEKTFPVVEKQVQQVLSDYERFFIEYPQIKNTSVILGYTEVLSRFADNPQKAFDTLNVALNASYLPSEIAGYAKLSMGDCQILLGNIWEAALLYSQVDKSFKEDRLGEEARYRNAKLSYYRGDFEYAQGQLSVLKASTSEFIANDALYLSVLITENTPEDKNFEALSQFSKADLLQFQHKYVQADALLDSLSKAFPENDLQDDILLQRAQLAKKMQQYDKAAEYLKIVSEKYADDVLADDAMMQLASIYETQFKDLNKAKETYENLIINFPGSSFAQQARMKISALGSKTEL